MKFYLVAFIIVAATRLHGQTNMRDSLHQSLIDSNLRAQTHNQLSQALYYSKLSTKPKTDLTPVISVLIAGLISFGSAAYLSIRSLRNEKEKSLAIQENELLTAKRLAASKLISKASQGFHSLTWVLWIARFTPDLLRETHVQEHDKKMNRLYSEIVAAQVNLAAYDKTLYESTKGIVDALYRFDANVGNVAAGLYTSKRNKAIKQLGEMWQGVYNYLMGIPGLFSSRLHG